MADWSLLECDYYNRYDAYPYNYYQEKELQPVPAKCMPAQTQPYCSPSPTLTLLLSPSSPAQPTPCVYKPPVPKGENPREIRNKAEKQRRDKMNQSISYLTSIVPTVVKPGRKLDKTSVLRLTAHYLRSHQYVFGNSIDRSPEFSRKFTQGLLNNLKGFLITITYKGLVVVVSPNVQEFLGYSEVELLGQNVLSIIHQDDHQILKDEIYPKSCTLGSNGELLLPKEVDADKKVMEALSQEKRNFIIRFKKMSQQRSDPPQYVTCHVEGSLRKSDRAGIQFDSVVHIGRRVRAKGENPFASGNDIVFIGMVRPSTETFITESGLESFRMEYRTRHSIDGEIIQCEQRIALVTGYMTQEVNGVNAMNFMHRDDVRWVIIALREMYDQHRLVGESCYRLMTKNGQFIYMRTVGYLDVDQQSQKVTSFVCTNTVVAEQEGKHLIKLMKKKFTLMVNNNDDVQEIEYSEVSDKKTLPVEDPRQLEKVILHLVTNLPSPNPNDDSIEEGGVSPSRLAIIPPRKERIQKAIEKSYSVIKTLRQNDLSSTESIMFHQFHDSSNTEEEETPASAFTPVPPTTRNSNGLVPYRPIISNAFSLLTRRNDPDHLNYSFPSIGDMERHLPMDYYSYPSTSQSSSSNLNMAPFEQAQNLTASSSFRPIPTTHTVTSLPAESFETDLVTPETSPVLSTDIDLDSDNVQQILQDFLDNSPDTEDTSPVSFTSSPFDLFGFSNNNLPTDADPEERAPLLCCEPVPSTSGVKRSLDEASPKPTGAKKRKTKKARRSQSTVDSETETNVKDESLNETTDSILLNEAAPFCAKSPAEILEEVKNLEAEGFKEVEKPNDEKKKESLDPYEFCTDSDSPSNQTTILPNDFNLFDDELILSFSDPELEKWLRYKKKLRYNEMQ